MHTRRFWDHHEHCSLYMAVSLCIPRRLVFDNHRSYIISGGSEWVILHALLGVLEIDSDSSP
jgi:hypothetical protein